VTDSSFRAAIGAIHAGDIVALEGLIDAEPRLLRDRVFGADELRARRPSYFRDPKLFWYVANNPTTVERMATNIVDVTRSLIARGVEEADLTYTLELVMTCAPAREQELQLPLARALLEAGATVTTQAIVAAAAHRELDVIRALVTEGLSGSLPVLAVLGSDEAFRRALPHATADEVQTAFALAVINQRLAAATAALDAGARIDAFLPVHAHSTALHQAAAGGDVAMIEMLISRGARSEVRDALWQATPLEWAIHEDRPAARAILERR
jgi:hypothetical protein